MYSTIEEMVDAFPTTPFLFVGSGLTRRYYGLPNWEGLLKELANRVSTNPLTYSRYQNQAKKDLPMIATLIENDFNNLWFAREDFRNVGADGIKLVEEGVSPFKLELAASLEAREVPAPEYEQEIRLLAEVSARHITGFITTNYDCFLEKVTQFKSYIGQNELIFSHLQGVGEIYKIHGSLTKPDSLIINSEDYTEFDRHCAYLAAKLMTIFMEYPIIFIGYSISDSNIQKILVAITECLPEDKYDILKDRFIFIEYVPNQKDVEIAPMTMKFGNNLLEMTKVTMADFAILYRALERKSMALPVKLLRMFKDEFYQYTMTHTPTPHIHVASLDDSRVEDDNLMMAIGKPGDLSLHGLSGISGKEWYEDAIFDNLTFSSDDMLSISYPEVVKHDSILPIYKHLSRATKRYPNIAIAKCFDELISATIKKQREKRLKCERNIPAILASENRPEYAMEFIAHLREEEIDIDALEDYLHQYLTEHPNALDKCSNQQLKTNLRRLIRIYDWLKYQK